MRLEFIVDEHHSGLRIDTFLARHLRNYTAWRLHRMVDEGLATLNGFTAGRTWRVGFGDVISIRLVDPPDKLLDDDDGPVPIIYEDPWLLVIDKPMGLIAHPVADYQTNTLSNFLQAYFDSLTVGRGIMRPGVVHRLDRMTSGLMVLAKDVHSHRLLARQFEAGGHRKMYQAIVEGCPDFEEIILDQPIGMRPEGRGVVMTCDDSAVKARKARTDVRVLRRYSNNALVECRIHTGRNHQIRIHLATLGFPVRGDALYTAGGAPLPRTATPTDLRHALHASELEFVHPIWQKRLTFRSVPGCDFWDLLQDD